MPTAISHAANASEVKGLEARRRSLTSMKAKHVANLERLAAQKSTLYRQGAQGGHHGQHHGHYQGHYQGGHHAQNQYPQYGGGGVAPAWPYDGTLGIDPFLMASSPTRRRGRHGGYFGGADGGASGGARGRRAIMQQYALLSDVLRRDAVRSESQAADCLARAADSARAAHAALRAAEQRSWDNYHRNQRRADPTGRYGGRAPPGSASHSDAHHGSHYGFTQKLEARGRPGTGVFDWRGREVQISRTGGGTGRSGGNNSSGNSSSSSSSSSSRGGASAPLRADEE